MYTHSMEKGIASNDVAFVSMLANYPRVMSTSSPVCAAGLIPEKTHIVDHHYPRDIEDIAFVTDGDGFFEIDGERISLKAPFAFIEAHSHHFRYGPHRKWRQFYLSYRIAPRLFFKRWGIDGAGPLWWPIASLPAVNRLISELREAIDLPAIRGYADRIDALAELLILESLCARESPDAPDTDARILDAEQYVRANYQRPIRLEELCRRFGFSLAGFHRHWKRLFRVSPADMIAELRLHAAARELTHGNASIKEAASSAGFADQRYFARIFKRTFGMTPTDFRKNPSMAR